MPYLSFTAPFGYDDYDLSAYLTTWRDLGGQACQLLRAADRPVNPHEARRLVEDHGLRFDAVHGRFKSEIDLSAPTDDGLRRRSVEAMIEDGDLCLELGGRIVIVHPSAKRTKAEREQAPDPKVLERRWATLEDSLDALATAGERQGIVYAIENIPSICWIGGDSLLLADLVRQRKTPALGMCFDTGHANIEAKPPGPDCTAQFEACADVVVYTHIHDNAGDSDDHLIPGEGTIDWRWLSDAFRRHSRRDLPMMLELFHTETEIQAKIESQPGFRDHLHRVCGLH